MKARIPLVKSRTPHVSPQSCNMLLNKKWALPLVGAVVLIGGYFALAAVGPQLVTKTNEFLHYIEHDVPPLVGALSLVAVIAIR